MKTENEIKALIDLSQNDNGMEVEKALSTWDSAELIETIDNLLEYQCNEFKISVYMGEWQVCLFHHVKRDKSLNMALFKILQACLEDNEIKGV